jgi:hypothetical protein
LGPENVPPVIDTTTLNPRGVDPMMTGGALVRFALNRYVRAGGFGLQRPAAARERNKRDSRIILQLKKTT